MLGLGRKLILETFNKWGFFNDFLYQSRHSVMCWAKGKFSNSCKPNIWEFYKVLVQVTFATSQTKLMSNRENFVDEFDSQAAKQIKSLDLSVLGNIKKISILCWNTVVFDLPSPKMNYWNWHSKTKQKQTKFSESFQNLIKWVWNNIIWQYLGLI